MPVPGPPLEAGMEAGMGGDVRNLGWWARGSCGRRSSGVALAFLAKRCSSGVVSGRGRGATREAGVSPREFDSQATTVGGM